MSKLKRKFKCVSVVKSEQYDTVTLKSVTGTGRLVIQTRKGVFEHGQTYNITVS